MYVNIIFLFFHHRCDSFVYRSSRNEELFEMDTLRVDIVNKPPQVEKVPIVYIFLYRYLIKIYYTIQK